MDDEVETADAVAIYGAGLSTALALTQGFGAWRRRTKVSVSAEVIYSAGASSYGTPVQVRHGDDVLTESVEVSFLIRNLGGSPVQVIGLLLESLTADEQTLQTHQIAPKGIPVVMEPGTTIEARLQKEQIDLLESCTFVGIVDGTGRRHAMPRESAAAFIEKCWRLPTRVGVYQRRDDPSERVAAFQLRDAAQFTSRPSRRRVRPRTRVIARRPRPLLETLLSGDQARVRIASGQLEEGGA